MVLMHWDDDSHVRRKSGPGRDIFVIPAAQTPQSDRRRMPRRCVIFSFFINELTEISGAGLPPADYGTSF